ncbi:hypothetical protein [Pleionea sp. CnH1-48]|uniref:hypothetical protein n=1 Tax=Pleionea sp. CnH1-48 TaxID=2954494 RepID=UPI00209688B8|nr:hypothetical protein [Pleionea sp. CnH1-48]MCO7223386.1 hypothetical protein [Pleionea sp. CnH1-48]
MTLTDFIKHIAVPIISVGTAVMVGILNYQVSQNDLALRDRDQQLEERISEIDLLIKRSKEERAERESNQDFNIRIYDIVTQSLEEGNPKKQEAAKAFVIVMVEEPLRSSLLNVLKQGGEPAVKANIGRILAQEEKFLNKVYAEPEKQRSAPASYNWGQWDFDVFWCSSSGNIAKSQAKAIGDQLLSEGAKGRVRIRELPESINAKAGYQIDGYTIRKNKDETEAADAIKALAEKSLKKLGNQSQFSIGLTRQKTPWYISVFVCPN